MCVCYGVQKESERGTEIARERSLGAEIKVSEFGAVALATNTRTKLRNWSYICIRMSVSFHGNVGTEACVGRQRLRLTVQEWRIKSG